MGCVEHHDGIDPEIQPQKKCKRAQKLKSSCMLLLILIPATIIAKRATTWISTSVTQSTVSVSYLPPSNVTNPLLATFEKVISCPDLVLQPDFRAYVPLILENRKILCRSSHKDIISNSRICSYIEMLHKGLELSDDFVDIDESRSIPIVIIESDNNGCSNQDHIDMVSFPRLTWHTPSPKYGTGWCQAIGMPGYESWNAFRNKHTYHDSWLFDYTWNNTFKKYERKYPWESKIDRAIWRGSTTGPEKKLNITFDDLSRAILVKKSMDRPDIIDAGFTSFVQGWEREEHLNKTIVSSHIPFDDLMKYKAIIDIDGNTWSSRFAKLLCTNSVVIKVRERKG